MRGGATRRVVCLGAHIVDTLGRPVTAIPAGQGRQVLDEIRITAAGTGAGTAVDLAKLGVSVATVGAVGQDTLGDFLLTELDGHGVDARAVARLPDVQTGSSILPIRPNGDRPALVVRGANGVVRARDLDLAPLHGADVLHVGAPDIMLGLAPEELERMLAGARATGTLVSLDVLTSGEDAGLRRLAPALAHVDYFLPNEEQLLSFTEEDDLTAAARRVIALGTGTVVVTRGHLGASVVTATDRVDLPAYPVDVLDTTGCGDAVSAGLIAGLVNGLDAQDSTRLGLAAASLVAGGLGSDAGIRDLASTARIVIEAGPDDVAARVARALDDVNR